MGRWENEKIGRWENGKMRRWDPSTGSGTGFFSISAKKM